ncbi:hypothetical protein DYB36_004259 [Aphanomyces astaci]|uniref:Cilia- and flagella-associated protein 206 n=2 Tax=Aphanomyces astaci TaxID=112090 RepID=A0A397BHS5_APHAT|nr:hypothetical protein DYB36_004259 [Aphanomyces astaci]
MTKLLCILQYVHYWRTISSVSSTSPLWKADVFPNGRATLCLVGRVVQDDANRFCLDGDVDADGLAALTQASVTTLLQKDSPSLETIKMQLDFDLCYVKHEEEVDKARAAKAKKVAALHRSISLLQPNGTGDFDTLTTLYRQKFQLKELSSIVGGIRLFNKEIGKGGAGITLTLELNNKRQFLSYLQSLYEDIDVSVDKISRIMTTYDNELNTLKALVGARTSLPKGQVYPVFEALSKAWEDLDAEHQLLLARSRSIKAYFRNAYHVFVNERALDEFMADPGRFVGAVHDIVVRKPELIYLLRLQESFPETSMASLMKLTNNRTHVHPLLAPHAVQKVDAGTSTPVHFVEKNLDVNYEWNEWSLRRRAVKIANLRNYKTVSAQTTLSNFRAHVEQQVWLPTDGTTQTGHDKGTNPTKTITYFAGLRGTPSDKKTASAYVEDGDGKEGGEEQEEHAVRPAIVSYTFDL